MTFNTINQFLPYAYDPEPIEPIEEFVVIESNEFRGFKKKLCRLVKGVTGEDYLKPIKEYPTEYQGPCHSDIELDDRGLPTVEGWPASAKTVEEYWEGIQAYPGGSLRRQDAYVRNLLNDIALNIQNESVTVVLDSKHYPILDQVVSDLRRTSIIQINGKKLFDIKGKGSVERFVRECPKLDAVRITYTECLEALNNNYPLTSNALKLSTQATMGHLGTIITQRFLNPDLLMFLRCPTQSVIINTKDSGITTIFYNTIWNVWHEQCECTSCDKERYLAASVEISILTKDLEKSIVKASMVYEKCSPFVETYEEAENWNLHLYDLPSGALDLEGYDRAMLEFVNKMESLEKLYCYSILRCYSKYQTLTIEKFPQAFFGSALPLRSLRFNGEEIYPNEAEYISLSPDIRNQKSYLRFLKLMGNDIELTNRALCFCLHGLNEYVTNLCQEQFTNLTLKREAKCIDYSVDILIGDNEVFEVTVDSTWGIRDCWQGEGFFVRYQKVILDGRLPLDDLVAGDAANLEVIQKFQNPNEESYLDS